MARIAFLGTGVMGIGMAKRLMEAGHDLAVFNRTAEKTRPLIELGARLALTPREAADGAEVVFAMVGDDEASEHIWMGALDGALAADLAKNTIIVECSTLSHDWVMELSAQVSGAGHTYIDCPVTGYPHMAAAGELTLFVGANDADLARAREFLDPLCVEIIHFGPVGAGTAYKLTVNLMGSVQIAGAAEGLLIAEKAGLNWQTVGYALSKGAAASPQVVRNSERMIAGGHDQNIAFSGRWRLKDTLYGLRLAEKFGHDAQFGSVAAKIYQMLVDQGFGDENETRVVDVLRSANDQSQE